MNPLQTCGTLVRRVAEQSCIRRKKLSLFKKQSSSFYLKCLFVVIVTSLSSNHNANAEPGNLPTSSIVGSSKNGGTVYIRKPFKLFVREQLLRHLSLRDTPVRAVIAELAQRGGINIIVDKSVVGNITGELNDLTLNEAMDSVLVGGGLESRIIDDKTVVIGTPQSMIRLGLNRPITRTFKLSYAHPYDVANILQASVFNKGYTPDFKERYRSSSKIKTEANPSSSTRSEIDGTQLDEDDRDIETETETQISRDQQPKTLRGSIKEQVQEGVGFNNASVDPGTQQIRQIQEISADYAVSPNDGGAIVMPDSKGRQVIVVGTEKDIIVAEEAIKLLDMRPKQVHLQASLVELTNQGVRQLGATLNAQGQGVSGSVMGNSTAPVVNGLPGLGTGGTPFSGVIGSLLPTVFPSIAGVQPVASSASGLDILSLGGSAGGDANIATLPSALNFKLQLLLQTNKAKVIANPSLVVVDNTEALITIANEVIHKVTSTVSLGVVTTNVELAKAGIFLNILPRVTEDGFVRLRLRPQVSTPLGAPQTFGSGSSQTTVTLLNVRDIITQEVRIKNGQTLVVGGLFTEQEAAILSKVPFLAEAPILGAFFRTTYKGRNRTELMLLITPSIVEEDKRALSSSEATGVQ